VVVSTLAINLNGRMEQVHHQGQGSQGSTCDEPLDQGLRGYDEPPKARSRCQQRPMGSQAQRS
jgi:hypothetical protein